VRRKFLGIRWELIIGTETGSRPTAYTVKCRRRRSKHSNTFGTLFRKKVSYFKELWLAFWPESLKRSDHLEDRDVDGK